MILPKKRVKNGKYMLTCNSSSANQIIVELLVKTVISVLKRVFGDKNQSRSDKLRNKSCQKS